MKKGFTLIELMIVVTIIAIVAAIGIPNLMASRISSNEIATIAAMRTYLSAQNQFRRTDFYGRGLLQYANPGPGGGTGFPDLYEVGGPGSGGTVLKLVDVNFAMATVDGPARSGYVFGDIEYGDYTLACGLSGAPRKFGRSGRNLFVIDITGTVYQGQGSEGCVPLTQYPDVTSGWIPVGSEG